jgi:hypothetical protein
MPNPGLDVLHDLCCGFMICRMSLLGDTLTTWATVGALGAAAVRAVYSPDRLCHDLKGFMPMTLESLMQRASRLRDAYVLELLTVALANVSMLMAGGVMTILISNISTITKGYNFVLKQML